MFFQETNQGWNKQKKYLIRPNCCLDRITSIKTLNVSVDTKKKMTTCERNLESKLTYVFVEIFWQNWDVLFASESCEDKDEVLDFFIGSKKSKK